MRAAGPCRKELHFPALGRAGKARAQSWVAQLHSGGFQQEVSPSPGDTVNAGSCSKPVLTLTPELLSKPGLRSPLASEGQGQHKVSQHLLRDLVEVSQLTSHQLVPYSQMSLSRAEGRRQLEAAPLSPAEPGRAAQTAADISFLRGCVGADF